MLRLGISFPGILPWEGLPEKATMSSKWECSVMLPPPDGTVES